MTKKDYIKSQAQRFGVTVKEFMVLLKRTNEEVVPCNCGHICCSGHIIQPIS